jgi:hypothetical protein
LPCHVAAIFKTNPIKTVFKLRENPAFIHRRSAFSLGLVWAWSGFGLRLIIKRTKEVLEKGKT